MSVVKAVDGNMDVGYAYVHSLRPYFSMMMMMMMIRIHGCR